MDHLVTIPDTSNCDRRPDPVEAVEGGAGDLSLYPLITRTTDPKGSWKVVSRCSCRLVECPGSGLEILWVHVLPDRHGHGLLTAQTNECLDVSPCETDVSSRVDHQLRIGVVICR